MKTGLPCIREKRNEHPGWRVLEISSHSTEEAGIRLSAFHLPIKRKSGEEVSVECVFQAGKVFHLFYMVKNGIW